MIKYEVDPLKIRKKSSKLIREQLSLDHLSELEQKIAIEMIQVSGDTTILEDMRFSKLAVDIALKCLADDYELLCDTEMVACGLKAKYLKDEPICLIRKANVISQAKAKKHTRSMEAVDLWKPYFDESIILIGAEPTALFRLLEILEEMKEEDDDKKPLLIIATPSGFTGAAEAKEYLWNNHEKLGIPCITLLGSKGSSSLCVRIMNALLKMQKDIEIEQN